MAIEFLWQVTNLTVLPESNLQDNVVHSVWWVLKGLDTETNANCVVSSVTPVPFNDDKLFVDYNTLSQNTVIDWVIETKGELVIDDLKSKITKKINAINANTAMVVAPPWVNEGNGYSGEWPPKTI
jgi:hypothetical protein